MAIHTRFADRYPVEFRSSTGYAAALSCASVAQVADDLGASAAPRHPPII
jgi:hypothetical protein